MKAIMNPFGFHLSKKVNSDTGIDRRRAYLSRELLGLPDGLLTDL